MEKLATELGQQLLGANVGHQSERSPRISQASAVGVVKYGCAKLPIEWFSNRGNRYIKSFRLSSDVEINEEDFRQIQNYLICSTDLKH